MRAINNILLLSIAVLRQDITMDVNFRKFVKICDLVICEGMNACVAVQ